MPRIPTECRERPSKINLQTGIVPRVDFEALGHIASVMLIDYFAVIVGVVTGALFGVSRKLDVVGSISTALLTGFGGGIIRDILLHSQGFFFMEHPTLVVACISAAILVFSGAGYIRHLDSVLNVADAFSIALYALAGAAKAWSAGVNPVYVVLLGTITAVGGGALATIFIGETPRIFKSSDYYAIAGFIGAFAYCCCTLAGLNQFACSIICVGACLATRAISLKFNLTTKSADAGKDG